MKPELQPKRHPSSQIGELASTAVQNALERRARVLSAAELEEATGGAKINVLVDWQIAGGLIADYLQTGPFAVNPVQGLDVQGLRQF